MADDKELFEQAFDDKLAAQEQAKPDPAPEVVETPEARDEQPRREDGKFAAKPKAEEAKPETVAEPEKERQQDHRIPLAEHLSVRERAQAAERERDDSKRRIAAMERELEQLRQPKAEPKEAPDPYADPQAFRDVGIREALTPLEQRLEANRLATSEMLATDKYGAEVVSAAFTAMETALSTDPMARFEYQRIMAAKHPYAELVSWNKRQTALKEVGDDPTAYRTRLQDDLLKDPAFLAKAIEAAKGQASQPANGSRPATRIELPSLNRATGNGGTSADPVATSDGEIFKELFPVR